MFLSRLRSLTGGWSRARRLQQLRTMLRRDQLLRTFPSAVEWFSRWPTPRDHGSMRQIEWLEPRVVLDAVTWDGGAGSFHWNDAANWSNDSVPTGADDVFLDIAGTPTITTGGGISVRSLVTNEAMDLSGDVTSVGAQQFHAEVSLSANAVLTGATITLSSPVNLQANALTISPATTGTVSGVISGSGTVTVNGSGSIVTLSAVNAYTGVTSVLAGTLSITGTVGGNVTLSSGAFLSGTGTVHGTVTSTGGRINAGLSPGILTLGSLVLDAASIVNIELGGEIAGLQHDRINVTGSATLAGTLNVTRYDHFGPGIGHSAQSLLR